MNMLRDEKQGWKQKYYKNYIFGWPRETSEFEDSIKLCNYKLS